jgi:hypothetical protein
MAMRNSAFIGRSPRTTRSGNGHMVYRSARHLAGKGMKRAVPQLVRHQTGTRTTLGKIALLAEASLDTINRVSLQPC